MAGALKLMVVEEKMPVFCLLLGVWVQSMHLLVFPISFLAPEMILEKCVCVQTVVSFVAPPPNLKGHDFPLYCLVSILTVKRLYEATKSFLTWGVFKNWISLVF